MERLIGFDPQLLADSAITGFAVLFLFFILSYLLFNPAKDMLKKRRERVAGDLDSAKEAKAQAEALKAEYEEKLAGFKKQADAILEDARKSKIKYSGCCFDYCKQGGQFCNECRSAG